MHVNISNNKVIFPFRHHKQLTLRLINIKTIDDKNSLMIFRKGLGIKHRFNEPLMADISHSFCFLFCVTVVIQTYNQLNKKRCQNDVRLRRFGSS